ncbi:hypothetical protein L596_028182 [Steinernema carpocapsae]|uniref:Uncharacterized protein n=1 Tax=Steinernema carpocapsae TaxID=34508 RepID=A0A4U5LXQ7_STECR|nr:hypothetical protein L596_028182 [Steinernema carpocapsae]
MKMHQKTIKRLEMETFMNFIQNDLSENFGFSNDEVMKALYENLKKLQADRVAIPPLQDPTICRKWILPKSRAEGPGLTLWEADRRLSSGGEFLARFRGLRCLKAGIYPIYPEFFRPSITNKAS